MLAIPSWLQTEYRAWLRNLAIPMNQHGFFMKWLRYYLDFCQKYHMVDSEERTLSSFLDKLSRPDRGRATLSFRFKRINRPEMLVLRA